MSREVLGHVDQTTDAHDAGGPSALTFAALRVANDARALEWAGRGGETPSLEFRAIELAGEVGELLNALKKRLRADRGMAGGVDDRQAIEDELADVAICLDLVASDLGVDLGRAVGRKFNATSGGHGFAARIEPERGVA